MKSTLLPLLLAGSIGCHAQKHASTFSEEECEDEKLCSEWIDKTELKDFYQPGPGETLIVSHNTKGREDKDIIHGDRNPEKCIRSLYEKIEEGTLVSLTKTNHCLFYSSTQGSYLELRYIKTLEGQIFCIRSGQSSIGSSVLSNERISCNTHLGDYSLEKTRYLEIKNMYK